jgi:hypothetical protein
MIYCIGNSHANFFTNTAPGAYLRWSKGDIFMSYFANPMIAYNFKNNHYLEVVKALKDVGSFSMESDYVMPIVGEIDCRWHLPFQINKQERNVESVVEECVDRYFQSILDFKSEGYNIVVWGGHPSTTGGHDDRPSSPVYGECLGRNKIAKYWSDSLEKLCLFHKIPFVALVDELIDSDGLTRMEHFRDNFHLKSDTGLVEIVIEKLRSVGVRV